MKTNTLVTSFKALTIGHKFEFYHPGMENSGMATGPWVKTSARCYKRIDDGMQCEVGSILTSVVIDCVPDLGCQFDNHCQ